MNKHYITGIDGLRTLGVLAIIFYHLSPSVLSGGYLGVLIFFVLTGYLITSSLISEREKSPEHRVKWGRFILKRLKRLYPMLIFVFLVSSFFFFIFQPKMLIGMRDSFVSSLLSVNNWWQILNGSSYFQNFTVTANDAFKNIYFLSIEGQFYLVCLIILPIFLRLKRGISFFLTAVLSVASGVAMALLFNTTDPTRSYYGTDTRLFALFIGMAMAFVWQQRRLKTRTSAVNRIFSYPLAIILTAALLVAIFILPDQNIITYYGGMYAFSIVSALLIALISHPALNINRFFSNRVFSWIGSRSYGIYLWQLPVLVSISNYNINIAKPINIVWEFAIIAILAEFSYRFIEKPFHAITWKSFKDFYIHNLVSVKKLPIYSLTILSLLGLVIILSAPAQAKDIAQLQTHITQASQQTAERNKALEDAAKKAASSSSSSSSVASSSTAQSSYPPAIMNIANTYGISPAVAQKAQGMAGIAVGDSVLLDVSSSLQAIFPNLYIDGQVGRQVTAAPGVISSVPANIRANAQFYLINLGANGTIPASSVATIMQEAGGKPVYWCNVCVPRSWEAGDNTVLADAAKQYPNLHILDWYGLASKHPEYFVSDQVHLTTAGISVYTKMASNGIAQNP